MQQLLKQSTAATTIVGPILDSAGVEYTGAVISDLNITKNGTTAAMAAAATLTHNHNGHYILVFTSGNTDTLGRLDITCNKATYAMPPKVFDVVAAAVFDTLVTNGTLASTTSGRTIATDASGIVDANVEKWNATAVPAEHTAGYPIVTVKDGAGTGEINTNAGAIALVDLVTTTTTATNLTNLPTIPANWLTAAGTAADFSTEIRTAINGGDYALATDANGRIRIVDGTGAGELDTASGVVLAKDHAGANLATAASIAALNNLSQAQAQTASEAALVTHRLDELLNADSDIDGAAPPTVGSVFHELMTKTAGSFTFDQTTDSLEAIRDKGDAAWTTATGFSTHSAADIWAVATRLLTAGTNIALAKGVGVTGFNDITAADVWASGTRTLSALGFTLGASDLAADTITSAKIAAGAIDADALATDAVQEIRDAITGGAYALSTDANGRVRIVDGTAAGEINTNAGAIALVDLVTTTTTATNLTTNNDKTGYALTSGERDSIAAAHLDLTDGIETGITPRKALRAIAAKAAGLISGAGTGTEVIKAIGAAAGGTTRLTATVDSSGNITAWTLGL